MGRSELIQQLLILENGMNKALQKGAFNSLVDTTELYNAIVHINNHLMTLPDDSKKKTGSEGKKA